MIAMAPVGSAWLLALSNLSPGPTAGATARHRRWPGGRALNLATSGDSSGSWSVPPGSSVLRYHGDSWRLGGNEGIDAGTSPPARCHATQVRSGAANAQSPSTSGHNVLWACFMTLSMMLRAFEFAAKSVSACTHFEVFAAHRHRAGRRIQSRGRWRDGGAQRIPRSGHHQALTLFAADSNARNIMERS